MRSLTLPLILLLSSPLAIAADLLDSTTVDTSISSGLGNPYLPENTDCNYNTQKLTFNGTAWECVIDRTKVLLPAYTYNVTYGSWGACSASGSQSRTATCKRNDGAVVANSFCGSTIISQSCTPPADAALWCYWGRYRSGGGIRISYSCVEEFIVKHDLAKYISLLNDDNEFVQRSRIWQIDRYSYPIYYEPYMLKANPSSPGDSNLLVAITTKAKRGGRFAYGGFSGTASTGYGSIDTLYPCSMSSGVARCDTSSGAGVRGAVYLNNLKSLQDKASKKCLRGYSISPNNRSKYASTNYWARSRSSKISRSKKWSRKIICNK